MDILDQMRPELVEGMIRWYQWRVRVGYVNRKIIEIEEAKKAQVCRYDYNYYNDYYDCDYYDYYDDYFW